MKSKVHFQLPGAVEMSSSTSPQSRLGKDKESNRLPAPSGPFWTVLRNYGPAEIINGSYKRPDYVAVMP
jgi:hypothetical protein